MLFRSPVRVLDNFGAKLASLQRTGSFLRVQILDLTFCSEDCTFRLEGGEAGTCTSAKISAIIICFLVTCTFCTPGDKHKHRRTSKHLTFFFLDSPLDSSVRMQLKANPLAPTAQIAAAVGNSSPSKAIDPFMRRCVSNFVRRQRPSFLTSTIAGTLLESTYGAINSFCLSMMLQGLLAE